MDSFGKASLVIASSIYLAVLNYGKSKPNNRIKYQDAKEGVSSEGATVRDAKENMGDIIAVKKYINGLLEIEVETVSQRPINNRRY